jgi:8-oxo-dGTP pyrophosphatase MutT (NUDIX family)/phosphohistidine phosphatase SixA
MTARIRWWPVADDRLIEAAGGVLWRRAHDGGIEVAMVHRPKYDDWSIPKGKLRSREHPLIGALREVEEETGFTGRPGRSLGEIRYLKDGSPKRVRYWAVEAGAGEFNPGDEVDELRWLSPREAQLHLTEGRDSPIIDSYLTDVRPTVPIVVVRHGSAGDRATWRGDDRDRPLDDEGHKQALALVPLLEALHVGRVFSADVVRCLQTVQPFADERGLAIDCEPLMSELDYAVTPDAANAWFLEVLDRGEPVVVCSQGKVIPPLLQNACESLGGAPFEGSVPKGGFVVLQIAAPAAGLNPGERLVAIERYPTA